VITRNNFDLPVLEYYGGGASYSGGRRGDKKDDYNFHLTIKKTDDDRKIFVYIWYGIFNLENSTEISSRNFPADETGLSKAYDYIDDCYDEWAKEHNLAYISENA
jgi:hypothetical protein